MKPVRALQSPLAERTTRGDQISSQIASLLPCHTHYVQPLAGSLEVLLHKPISKFETVNDTSQELVTFWRVLRERPETLARACALTPHSRSEFATACGGSGSQLRGVDAEVESARRVWVRITQSQDGSARLRPQWRAGTAHRKAAGAISAAVEQMEHTATRLQSVTLECSRPIEVVKAWGGQAGVCMYVDLRAEAFGAQGTDPSRALRIDPAAVVAGLAGARAAVVLRADPELVASSGVQSWRRTRLGEPHDPKPVLLWSNRPLSLQEHLFDLSECAGSGGGL